MNNRIFGAGKWLPVMIMAAALAALPACTGAPAATVPTPQAAPPPQATPAATTGPASSADLTAAVAKTIPSVVIIEVEAITQDATGQPAVQPAAGSGWVVAANGLIVTNKHVVEGAQTVTITLADGRQFTATAVKTDTTQDLAVVKIDAQNLPAAAIGDSSKLELGQPVAVIGNALDLGVRVTGGLVSMLNVSITLPSNGSATGLIETDAAINPGNSGGVVIDISGAVVGIVNAGLDDPRIDAEAFGYAIPISQAMPVINQLITEISG